MEETFLVLDNVRSCHNVGSLFRSSDTFGVNKVILGGITPTPIDKYGRKRPDIAKVALGAEDSVPYEHVNDILFYLDSLKKEDNKVVIIALEQGKNSVCLYDIAEKCTKKELDLENKRILLVVGNEVGGISPEILALSDFLVEIPQLGSKESLNVAVAGGICLYEFARMRKKGWG